MNRSNLKLAVAVLVTIVLTSIIKPLDLLVVFSQPQQETCRYFPETQRVICGRFLQYWQEHGGLPQFGYPLSNEFLEVSDLDKNERLVQYFERAVFERHVENKPPYDVLLSQLGTLQFEDRYASGNPMGSYPIYPNVEQLSAEREISDVTIKFVTKDSPATVLAFYKSKLPPLGWALDTERADRMWFYYRPTNQSARRNMHLPAVSYTFLVQITGTNANRTMVEIGVTAEYPR